MLGLGELGTPKLTGEKGAVPRGWEKANTAKGSGASQARRSVRHRRLSGYQFITASDRACLRHAIMGGVAVTILLITLSKLMPNQMTFS